MTTIQTVPILGPDVAVPAAVPRICVLSVEAEIYVDDVGGAALVTYNMDIEGPYQEIAKRINPLTWDDIKGSAFKVTRYLADQRICAVETCNLLEPGVGAEWEGLMHEVFDSVVPGMPGSRIRFDNILAIKSAEVSSTAVGTPDGHLMTYRLDEDGSRTAVIPVPNGWIVGKLIRDQGFVRIVDANGVLGEPIESSYLTACKLLVFPEEMARELRESHGTAAQGLQLSLLALVEATATVISDAAGCVPRKIDFTVYTLTRQQIVDKGEVLDQNPD